MLFDDEEQIEVRHVISLAHHEVSIYSGGDNTPEGELFIKRNALCLSRKRDGPEMGPDSQISKPFYLFSENCSAKEDFYFALLKNQEQTFVDPEVPSPKHFDMKNIISLVQKLHSSEENIHSRWLNAMLGRIFLGIYKTRDLESLIREKLTKKISRVKTPSFLTNIAIQKIDTGEAAPYFTNLKLRDLTVEGECVVEADVKYTGNFRLEVAATVKIDLGTRFKTREVNLVLAVVLKRAEGHVLFKIKAPPSNRLWMAFQTMPKMEMAIEPIVSSRQITYTVILRQIENRIKEVVAETFVLPFWDDLPFFKTEHKKWRGGIFEGDDATVPSEDVETTVAQTGDVETVDQLEESPDLVVETRPIEKSLSMPVIEKQQPTGLFGRKIGRSANNSIASASSTSVESRGTTATTAAVTSPRSPTLTKTTTEPVVATDAAHADVFRPSSPPEQATDYMAALQSRSKESPLGTPIEPTLNQKDSQSSLNRKMSHASLNKKPSYASMSSRDGGETASQEEANAAPIVTSGRRNTASSAGSASYSDEKQPTPTSTTKDKNKSRSGSQTNNTSRGFFMRRDNSDMSLSGQSTQSDTSSKRNTLAAVTNAAVQARQWGWNAIQKQREARRNAEQNNNHHHHHVDLSQPMGRGQPLPPPGVPLPGPTNGTTRIQPPPSVARRLSQPQATENLSPVEARESHSNNNSNNSSNNNDRRPPPLPQRRRRGQSYGQDANPEHNMLVVEAPDDSQPNTPGAEEEKSMQLKPLMEGTEDEQSPSPTRPSTTSKVSTPKTAEAETTETPSSLQTVSQKTGSRESISTVPTVNDDDDFSGWLENDTLEEEPPVAPIAQEVK